MTFKKNLTLAALLLSTTAVSCEKQPEPGLQFNTVEEVFQYKNKVKQPDLSESFQKQVDAFYDLFSNEDACEDLNSHILLNEEGDVWTLPNQDTPVNTVNGIQQKRLELQLEGEDIVLGSLVPQKNGFPLAYSCLEGNEARLLSDENSQEKIHGKWRNLDISQEANMNVIESIDYITSDYLNRAHHSDLLKGIAFVESTYNPNARSNVATGIFQLINPVINDCDIPGGYQNHRFAQTICASNLLTQIETYLTQTVDLDDIKFKNQEEQDRALQLLTIQSYNTGMGNVARAFNEYKDNSKHPIEATFTGEEVFDQYRMASFGKHNHGFDAYAYVPKVTAATKLMSKSKSNIIWELFNDMSNFGMGRR